jgi:hypothetical protein
MKLTPSNPKGIQWEKLPSLPHPGRAGGGLWYDSVSSSLVYAAGAIRPNVGFSAAIESNSTFELPLLNLSAGWKILDNSVPYRAKYVSFVTTKIEGHERHYLFGGHTDEVKPNGNLANVFEWMHGLKKWERRADMSFGRGGASTSTIPYGCGFLVAGGTINTASGPKKTNDLSFYNAESDKWTKIGSIAGYITAPVCDIIHFPINGTDYMYCETGTVNAPFSFRSQISL